MGTKRKPRDLPDQQPAAKSRRITSDSALLHHSSPSDTREVELEAQDLSPEFAYPLSEPELIGDEKFEDQVEKDLLLEDAAFGSQVENQQVPEEPAEAFVHDSQHFPLTRANLERLAMSTNTKWPKTAIAESTLSGKSDGPKNLSTTAEGFQNRALENGLLDPVRSGMYPVKSEAITKTLDESRRSASPTQSQYNKFASRLMRAANEQETILAYDKFVLQDTDELHFESGYDRKVDKMWTEFPKDVGFNNGLSAPKPDIFEGFVKNTFPPNIKAIKSATLVKDNPRYVALPHMAIEYKAQDKSGHQAMVQAGYDGAAMVYSRNEALKYMGQEDAPREPSVLTAAVTGPQWDVYGHYTHPNDDTGRTEYYQHHLAGGFMANLDGYKRGRKTLRNMQDFGREQATDLRDRMKKDYDEHGLRRPKKGTAGGSSRGDNSAASNPASVISQKSAGNLPSPGQLTPKTAPSNASAGSARRDPVNGQQSRQAGPDTGKSPTASVSSSRSGASQAAQQLAMPPPPARPQPREPSITSLDTSRSPGPQAPKDSGGLQRQASGSSGGGSRAPSPASTQQAFISRRLPPVGRPVSRTSTTAPSRAPAGKLSNIAPVSSRASATSAASSASTSSTTSAEIRRYRVRDEDDMKDLQRRRSDSPDRNRPPRPEARKDVEPRKSLFSKKQATPKSRAQD